jgi:hypothetical protein
MARWLREQGLEARVVKTEFTGESAELTAGEGQGEESEIG